MPAAMPSPPETRASLMLRLPNSRDAAAWDEVVAVYGPLVYRLARRKGLQPADADDLVQEVLSAVARSIEQWLARPDRGSFRAWLFSITRNTAINFLTRHKHQRLAAGGNQVGTDFEHQTALTDETDDFDVEYRREVFRWASRQVRDAVSESTWQAFHQTTLEDLPVAEVAKKLDMTAGSIYIARSRVMTRLRERVRDFEDREA